MADGTSNKGDRRVRVKHDAISDEAPRLWRFPGKSHVGDT